MQNSAAATAAAAAVAADFGVAAAATAADATTREISDFCLLAICAGVARFRSVSRGEWQSKKGSFLNSLI